MCNDGLAALKFIPDLFVTSKTVKKLLPTLYVDDNVLYFNEDSVKVLFSCNEMGILNIDLNNINLDVTYYNEDDPETIVHIRLLSWPIKFEKRKAFKKEFNEELMLVSSIQIGGIGKFYPLGHILARRIETF